MGKAREKLIYLHLHYEKETGAFRIQQRNEELLRYYFGEKNMKKIRYKVLFPYSHDSKIETIIRWVAKKTIGNLMVLRINLAILLRKPDVVFVDCTWITGLWNCIFDRTEVICFFHNVEKNYLGQMSKSSRLHPIEKGFYRKIEENEERLCRYASKCICINERDSSELFRYYGRKADLILKSSMKDFFVVNRTKLNKADVSDRMMLFIGFDFFGNTDGLFWFIEKCMNHVPYELCVVGAGMEKYKDRYPDKRVRFEGYVDNLNEYYQKAECVVLPIISGSGMKTKTCEALMFGKIIVGTDEAFEGYSGIDETGCIRCNTEEEFIETLNDCYEYGCKPFNEEVRDYYLKYYSNEARKKQFEAFLDSMLEISNV